jgi:hypothetical protein
MIPLDYAVTQAPPAFQEIIKDDACAASFNPLLASAAYLAELPSANATVQRAVSWETIVQKNFAAIKTLGPGWDGPRSKRVDSKVMYRAFRILRDALADVDGAVAPYIVPAHDGSIQLEWHTKSYELEFLISPSGRTEAWVHNRSSGATLEGEGDKAVGMFLSWARRVASPLRDAIAAPIAPTETRQLLAA